MASGWAARLETWESFADNWQRALAADKPLAYFKLNDALGLKGPFDGWTETERNDKLRVLAGLIPHDGTITGVGCYVRRADFEQVKPHIRRQIYKDPYYVCVTATMMNVNWGFLGADKFDFILDKSKESERMRMLFYGDIKPLSPKFGECFPLDDQKTPPLQAADLHAGLSRQLYELSPRPIMVGIEPLEGVLTTMFELQPKGLMSAITLPPYLGKQ
jgi:hypothetical protein